MSKQKTSKKTCKRKSKPQPSNGTEPEPQKPGNVYDTFVKRFFGRIMVFVDFLLWYADAEFIAEIDLTKIRPAPTHYIGKDGTERITDLVFTCPLKHGGGSLMAVIIFEHQSRSLREIPRKLHKYLSAIWDAERKAGAKILSAPYFIVLRTHKKPHRGSYPTMAALVAKGRDGKPLGHVPEIKYKVVDLPAWDFNKLVGGPVLRLALGILQTMTVGDENNIPTAFLPLQEISDEEQKVELTQELLDFVANALASHNRRMDDAMLSRILKPIFHDKEQAMIKTIFEEREAIGEARGFAKGKAENVAGAKAGAILAILRAKFQRVPKGIEKAICQMTDSVALDSLAVHAAQSNTLSEFGEALK